MEMQPVEFYSRTCNIHKFHTIEVIEDIIYAYYLLYYNYILLYCNNIFLFQISNSKN